MADNGTLWLLKLVSLVSHNKLHKHFPSLPQNVLKKIYKTPYEQLHLLMINEISTDICWLIEANVWLAGEFHDPFISYMSDFGKSTFVKKMIVERLNSECHNCVRLNCKRPNCKSLRMFSNNHEDKLNSLKMS